MCNLPTRANKYFVLLFLISSITLCMTFTAFAADITIAWDANAESDIAGYKLFYGTSSGNYDVVIDVGNSTNHTVANLEEGTTYYFVATAYDTDNNESSFSEELPYTIQTPNTAPSIPNTPAGPSNGYILTSYTFSTSGTDPDGDPLEYRFDWGDGEISVWDGAYSRSHAYSYAGDFCVKAQSIDIQGSLSGWSQCLNVNIAPQTHTITVSTGTNGSISPSGLATINHGADQTFSITADPNYYVTDVLVDNVSVGAVTSYTFFNVTQDHSIFAIFARENQTPIASAGFDQNVKVNQTVQLDGSSSSDPDGDPLTYKWSFASVPDASKAVLSSDTAVNPIFMADTPGIYMVQLIVNDAKADSQPDSITIFTENSPPIADAGSDQTIMEGQTTGLDGTGSSDPDGDISYYQWIQTSGPTVSLSDSSAAQTTFIAPDVGQEGAILTFDLSVTDSKGLTATDSCSVVVDWQNQPPTADAGPDQTVESGRAVTLNGANSTDKEDGIVAYQWIQTSGLPVSLSDPGAAQPTFPAPEVDLQGISLEFELTVIDANGLAKSDSCIVNVTRQNEPPIADAGGNILATPGESIILNGSGSHDIDDGITVFKWTQIEGTAVALSDLQSPSPVFTAPDVGQEGESFIFELTVTDQGGLKDTDTCIVNVSLQNQPPAAVTIDYMETTEGLQIELDGLQSTDSEDEIKNYRWQQLEGPPVTFDEPEAAQPMFSAPDAEPYGSNLVFNLVVKDKGGLKDSAKCSVFVFPKDSAPFAEDDAYSTVEGVPLEVFAPGVLANDSDVNGQSLSSILVSAPNNGSLSLNSDGSFIYTPFNNFIGTDFFTYISNDGSLDSNRATVSITVNQSNQKIYVSDITVDLNKKGPFYQAKAHVIIKDNFGNILKDAGVTGKWLKNDSIINEVSALTNGVGEAKLDSDKVEATSMEQLVFEIINVFKEGYRYDANINLVNDAYVQIP